MAKAICEAFCAVNLCAATFAQLPYTGFSHSEGSEFLEIPNLHFEGELSPLGLLLLAYAL
ncbi:hypothetical protein D3C79_969510 [compost metagenome]